ncbi:MAG: 4Fe-4S binding protein [Bacillota bacterium]|jgi:Fe-S-cluster-containing hydrogenase component 2|nr:4Fe-4S binding protein [Candidatus Fermentithermobacillaceae bacterium]
MSTLVTTGVPSAQEIAGVTPPEERRARGPYATIECFQRIPCDPCHHSCRFGAIQEFEDINDIPKMDWSRCTGCGLCVAACPGLAIFVVDETYSETECLIAIPYEFAPLPAKGQEVDLTDRAGIVVAEGVVQRVVAGKKPSGTPVVWVSAPKIMATVVRGFALRKEAGVHG